jgi:hypothetical protein
MALGLGIASFRANSPCGLGRRFPDEVPPTGTSWPELAVQHLDDAPPGKRLPHRRLRFQRIESCHKSTAMGPLGQYRQSVYSRDRSEDHPRQHLAAWRGTLQADAFGGYGQLYEAERQPGPVLEASCWAYTRRKFFELADIKAATRRKAQRRAPQAISPMALEAAQRTDALFDISAASTVCRPSSGLAFAGKEAPRLLAP